ncbi:MATE family efflux transporter [Anaerorhabdus sp.]|uniref:MATE family efflux transporter n=1 Tax=Anaerorhabdus sp. TaxID=1872524 RepID=UPI002B1F187B|nr:MATE family efflux transporter [Anaerorhabdus sp.]MEA4875470.1 MATE family efflux transporter [Anaerorhabdus sp.]
MTTIKTNKMATWSIPKLLFSMSIPAMFSMLIQALYNIVDTIYISQISEQALFAIGLVFPMQMIITSLSLGGSIGTSTLVARRLGQQNHKEANKVASTGLILALFHSFLCALMGVFLAKPFLQLFTQDAQVIDMGFQYLSIVMTVSFGVFVGMYFERILQAQGNMILPMISLLIGAITNIILDPIFIFGYFGIPAMGIKGAAIATVIGQIFGMIFITICMFVGKHEVKFQFKGLHLRWTRIKEIYQVGLPVAIMQAVGSVTTTCMNFVLVTYSASAVTALSIYFKLNSFVFMPIFGLNQGSLPILSYNFGSQDVDRYRRTVKLYLATAVGIMAAGTALFMFGTDFLLGMFNPSESLLEVARLSLRIISISFVFVGVSIAMNTVFQSLGKGVSSMIMTLLRQLIFLIPFAYIFGKIWGTNGVWAAYPVAELFVVLIYVPICYKTFKKAFNVK